MSESHRTVEALERSGRSEHLRRGTDSPSQPATHPGQSAARSAILVSETLDVSAPASGVPAYSASGGMLPSAPGTFSLASDGNVFPERRSGSGHPRGERRAGDATSIVGALQNKGSIALRVYGASMLPWVRPGDIALVRSATPDTVRCGDIILFQRNARLFVHRLVEKRGALGALRFLAKGDAQASADGFVGQEEILGRVVRLYRGGRPIDLDSPGQLVLGLLISQISRHSRLGHSFARVAAAVTRPARRLLHALRPPNAPVC